MGSAFSAAYTPRRNRPTANVSATRPTLQFHGRAAEIAAHLGVTRASLSITHTAELAMASVILEDGR